MTHQTRQATYWRASRGQWKRRRIWKGYPSTLLAETPLELISFGDGIDDRWIIASATHRLDSGGYVTEVEGERLAE